LVVERVTLKGVMDELHHAAFLQKRHYLDCLSKPVRGMNSSDLLERMAAMFKSDVGPAVDGEYPRTQAYLSAVVLQKLSSQLRSAPTHAAHEAADREALYADITVLLADAPAGPALAEASAALADADDAAVCSFIEALYAARPLLGEARFAALLGRVRTSMRRSLDRRMEYAR
jgi:hypothetical protein